MKSLHAVRLVQVLVFRCSGTKPQLVRTKGDRSGLKVTGGDRNWTFCTVAIFADDDVFALVNREGEEALRDALGATR